MTNIFLKPFKCLGTIQRNKLYILEGFENMEKVWYFNRLKEGKRGINLGYHMVHWENTKKEIGLFKIITDIAHICHNCHNWWWCTFL